MLTGRNGYPHFRDEGLRPQIQLSQWFSVEITLYRHPRTDLKDFFFFFFGNLQPLESGVM